MVLEIDLNDFVGKTEHNGMSGAHPLLNVNNIHDSARLFLHVFRDLFIRLRFLGALKVAPKVLQQRHFLLKVFWIIRKSILLADILPICTSSLHVVEVEAVRIKDNLR